MYVCMYGCMDVCTYVCMSTCMYVNVGMYVSVRMCVRSMPTDEGPL